MIIWADLSFFILHQVSCSAWQPLFLRLASRWMMSAPSALNHVWTLCGRTGTYAKRRKLAALQQRNKTETKECLALVGFAEARGNGSQAMEAVMWVVQNRHVGSKGKTDVCNVIAQRGAFEGVTKLRFQSQLVAIRRGQQLPQVRTRDVVERRALREARQLAAAIVSRERTHDLTRGATHFYAPIAQRQLNRQTPEVDQGVCPNCINRRAHVLSERLIL